VKVSWICKLCKISERAARTARAELIRLGWISKDTGSFQRKLNRDGAYFIINVAWRRGAKRIAPLVGQNCTGSAPPIEKQETPYGSKDQKPAKRSVSGVCKANVGSERPTLRDIKFDDLRRLSRLRLLYAEATAAGWLQASEANLRNFVAAAARASRVDGDAVRVFVGIVRKGLWHHLTSADEDRANAALRRERERNVPRSTEVAKGSEPIGTEVGKGPMQFLIDLATRTEITGDRHTEEMPQRPGSVVSARNYSSFWTTQDFSAKPKT
jgi:hypothetical protein